MKHFFSWKRDLALETHRAIPYIFVTFIVPLLFLVIVWLLTISGCGLTKDNVKDASKIFVKTSACILQNDHLPPRDIAILCGVDNIDDVIEMLTAARAAEDKHTLTALRALGIGPIPRASVTATASATPSASNSCH